MRIALLSGEYPPQPGGIGDYTRALGSALAALGHGSVVLTIQGGQLLCYDLAAAERAPEPIAPVRGWGWASWTALRRALAELQPDVLHIQYQTGAFAMHPAINFLPWRLRAQTPRPRIAVTAHDLLPPYLFPKGGPARRWVTAALLACADALVLTNRADLATAAEMARRPATLIPIGSNIDAAPPPDFNRAAWRARLDVEAEQPLIAFFGLLSRSKGVDTLLAALAQVPSDARLLVVSEMFFAGWRATIDGAEVPTLRANYLFRGVVVPPGAHTVVFEYRPLVAMFGAALSLVALVVGAWLVRPVR